MSEDRTVGRRERKRAATRQAIADAALELFLEHGFDSVSVNQVAEKADVSTTTLFNYFSGKEALLFDRDDDFDRRQAEAVRGRPAGMSILEALRVHTLSTWVPLALDPKHAPRQKLISDTPALRAFSERLWLQHSHALGTVIARELGRGDDDVECATLARYVLDIVILTAGRDDVDAAVRQIFDFLAHGWRAET